MTRLTLELPKTAADALAKGFAEKDPELMALLEEFKIVSIKKPEEKEED